MSIMNSIFSNYFAECQSSDSWSKATISDKKYSDNHRTLAYPDNDFNKYLDNHTTIGDMT